MSLTIPFSRQQRITNSLLLNASFIDNLGLMHGKMGIAIYFYHLARETKNQIYEDYAGELIDEIYDEININTPCDFENGLAGIGWGIEYLVQSGFIVADTDDILEEFDNRLFKELINNTPKEIGLLNGLAGLGAYFLKRIQNPASNDEKISALTNKKTLIHLIDELECRTQNTTEIIPEPQIHSDTETIKQSNIQIFKPLKVFDITWDYPVLILFLAKLYEQDTFNFKVEKIISRLVEPLKIEGNLPKLHSNRLVLTLALSKLIQTISTTETTETTLNKLQTGINREAIKPELKPNCFFLRNGTSGIAWVYGQLFKLTGDKTYLHETRYWHDQNFESDLPDNGFAGINLENEANAFGLLEGLAGITWIGNHRSIFTHEKQ